jgi:hypothetical protein
LEIKIMTPTLLAIKSQTEPTTNEENVLRYETLEGKEYVVCPVAMITPGVHSGSNGPLRYESSELGKHAGVWNHKPIVVYHPEINGKGVSACDPVVINNRKIGLILNARYERNKLRCDAYIDLERVKDVDERVYDAICNGEMMEVSTGMFSDLEKVSGEDNGKKFIGTVKNIKPDHLAILPDKKGACSLADGAGLFQLNESHLEHVTRSVQDYLVGALTQKSMIEILRNAKSMTSIHESLVAQVRMLLGREEVWVLDVFTDGSFIYEDGDKLYRLEFTLDEEENPMLTSDPVEVERVVKYMPVSGFATNGEVLETPTTMESEMTKNEIVDGLIANDRTQFTEENREFLMGMDEGQLALLEPVQNAESPATPKEPNTEPEGEEAGTVLNESSEGAPSLEEYITNAPPEVQEVIRQGQAQIAEKKNNLVGRITANKNNKFTTDYLNGRTIEELEGLAALAAPTQNTESKKNYFGASGTLASPITKNEGEPSKEEGLQMAKIDWGSSN